jgi:hypothetical protein
MCPGKLAAQRGAEQVPLLICLDRQRHKSPDDPEYAKPKNQEVRSHHCGHRSVRMFLNTTRCVQNTAIVNAERGNADF